MTVEEHLKQIQAWWKELDEGPSPTGNEEYTFLVTPFWAAGKPILCAVNGKHDRCLVVPLQKNVRVGQYHVLEGLELRTKRIFRSGGPNDFLIVSCTNTQAHNLFDPFCIEVLRIAGKEDQGLFESVRRLAQQWRRMFSERRMIQLTSEQRLGLYGELHVLNLALQQERDVIYSWRGPERYKHDFYSSRASLEIKTTRLIDDWKVNINGIDQLSRTDRKPLYVCVLKVVSSPNKIAAEFRSIPDLVAVIRATQANDEEFVARLRMCGIDVDKLDLYEDRYYLTTETRLFLVDAEFPAIRRTSFADPALLSSISHLNYTLDLAQVHVETELERRLAHIFQELALS